MSDVVIRVEDLSKKYIIGHNQQRGYKTLREVITSSARSLTHLFHTQTSKQEAQYEEFWALKDVSFEVKRGEVIGIIGRNGAGKSTLLKILSRITEPTTGEVRVRGRIASLLEVGTGFHPELTGRENIFLNGVILGMTRCEVIRHFEEIIDFADVEKFLDTPVKHYSSGMYTRLAFAIAAHLKPDILLIDEVLAVGDLAFQRKCLGKIDAISKDGRTVIFVSHQMSMIRALCSRAVWLNLGKTVKDGIVDIVINEYERMYSKERIEVSQDFIKRDTSFLKNKTFYVDFIKILNEGGNPSNRFRYNESIKILVHFSGESSSPTYNLEVRIFDETDRLIIVESTAFHGLLLTRDVKLISFEINELKLTAGTYKLSLSAVDSQIDNRLDNWNECGFFEIYECSPFGFGHNLKNPTEGICAFASNIVILNP